MEAPQFTKLADNATLQRLSEVSRGLLKLHKALLDRERAAYERFQGTVMRGELLGLIFNHPQFAWLRSLSELIVLIDELVDADEPAAAEAEVLLVRTRMLLTASETGSEFKQRYYGALQAEPEIILLQGELRRLSGQTHYKFRDHWA